MIKTGIIGMGHLGQIHLQRLLELNDLYQVQGFFDIDAEVAAMVEKKWYIRPFPNYKELLQACEAVIIATPTTTHYSLARTAIEKNKHVFIEKPATETPEQALRLMEINRRHPVVVQVGHVERFNPALAAVRHILLHPMFIEGHRLAPFNPRGTDVPVVLDLMIHDIDIVLSLVKSNIRQISASGVAVVSDTPDIANARITFENGCVANLTASRISMKQMRKVRFFQKDAYIGLDFLEKTVQILRICDDNDDDNPANAFRLETPHGSRLISMETPPVPPLNAIREELIAFANSILGYRPLAVSLEDAYKALNVAQAVMQAIGNPQ